MKPYEINYFLAKNGSSQTAIAEELKLSPHTVCNIIHGRGKSKKIECLIASKIGKPVEDVFPNLQAA